MWQCDVEHNVKCSNCSYECVSCLHRMAPLLFSIRKELVLFCSMMIHFNSVFCCCCCCWHCKVSMSFPWIYGQSTLQQSISPSLLITDLHTRKRITVPWEYFHILQSGETKIELCVQNCTPTWTYHPRCETWWWQRHARCPSSLTELEPERAKIDVSHYAKDGLKKNWLMAAYKCTLNPYVRWKAPGWFFWSSSRTLFWG